MPVIIEYTNTLRSRFPIWILAAVEYNDSRGRRLGTCHQRKSTTMKDYIK